MNDWVIKEVNEFNIIYCFKMYQSDPILTVRDIVMSSGLI